MIHLRLISRLISFTLHNENHVSILNNSDTFFFSAKDSSLVSNSATFWTISTYLFSARDSSLVSHSATTILLDVLSWLLILFLLWLKWMITDYTFKVIWFFDHFHIMKFIIYFTFSNNNIIKFATFIVSIFYFDWNRWLLIILSELYIFWSLSHHKACCLSHILIFSNNNITRFAASVVSIIFTLIEMNDCWLCSQNYIFFSCFHTARFIICFTFSNNNITKFSAFFI